MVAAGGRHRSADGVDLIVNDDLIFRLMQFHHLAKLVGLAGFAPAYAGEPAAHDCRGPVIANLRKGGDQFALRGGNLAVMSISCPSRRMLRGGQVPGACRATTSMRSSTLRTASPAAR